ncbi:DUF3558 family protein [Saccharomonospora sp. NPDC046836]|uniref:DUF3558 family protein n=1 Tax=Saccharomonospora sp. NPDC046836 TaxID=3156921 RepID=UPI0033FAA5BA
MEAIVNSRACTTVLSFAALAGLALAGCSTNESGIAVPENPQSETSNAIPSNEGGASLAGLDPCTLLDTSEIARYGNHKPPERETIGTARTCAWYPRRASSSDDAPAIATIIRENAGVDDMNDIGQGVQRTQANGRDIGKAPGPGGCVIAIGVTATSRVDVPATGLRTEDSCIVADQLAVIVEPKLPRS